MPDTIPGVSPIKDDEGYYLEGVLAPDLLFVFRRGEGTDIITRVPSELLEPSDYLVWEGCWKNVRHDCTFSCWEHNPELEPDEIGEVEEESDSYTDPDEYAWDYRF
jgi:hypothetical protein